MALRKKYRKRTTKTRVGRRRRRSSLTKRRSKIGVRSRRRYKKKSYGKRRYGRRRYRSGPSLQEMAFVVSNYHPQPAAVANAATMTDAWEASDLGKRDYGSMVDSSGYSMSNTQMSDDY